MQDAALDAASVFALDAASASASDLPGALASPPASTPLPESGPASDGRGVGFVEQPPSDPRIGCTTLPSTGIRTSEASTAESLGAVDPSDVTEASNVADSLFAASPPRPPSPVGPSKEASGPPPESISPACEVGVHPSPMTIARERQLTRNEDPENTPNPFTAAGTANKIFDGPIELDARVRDRLPGFSTAVGTPRLARRARRRSPEILPEDDVDFVAMTSDSPPRTLFGSGRFQ